MAHTSTNSWIFSGFSVKKQKERNTVKPSGKRLKLDEAVDDTDLQSTRIRRLIILYFEKWLGYNDVIAEVCETYFLAELHEVQIR